MSGGDSTRMKNILRLIIVTVCLPALTTSNTVQAECLPRPGYSLTCTTEHDIPDGGRDSTAGTALTEGCMIVTIVSREVQRLLY